MYKLTQKFKIHTGKIALASYAKGAMNKLKFGAEHRKVKGYTHAY